MSGPGWRRLLGWERVDATLVGQSFAGTGMDNTYNSTATHEICDYVVQVPTADGGNRRLVIRVRSARVRPTKNGAKVPVLVDKGRTKAAFDFSDPRIDGIKAVNEAEKARKQAGAENINRKLNGR